MHITQEEDSLLGRCSSTGCPMVTWLELVGARTHAGTSTKKEDSCTCVRKATLTQLDYSEVWLLNARGHPAKKEDTHSSSCSRQYYHTTEWRDHTPTHRRKLLALSLSLFRMWRGTTSSLEGGYNRASTQRRPSAEMSTQGSMTSSLERVKRMFHPGRPAGRPSIQRFDTQSQPLLCGTGRPSINQKKERRRDYHNVTGHTDFFPTLYHIHDESITFRCCCRGQFCSSLWRDHRYSGRKIRFDITSSPQKADFESSCLALPLGSISYLYIYILSWNII